MSTRRSFLLSSSAAALTGCQMMPPALQQMQQPMAQAPQTGPFMLGIDMLAARGFDLLRGKRVGLITNHTAYTSRGELTRVAMKRALGPGLVALYGPEHGIDGTVGAGKHIATRRDPVTGLIVHSLYGPTRKPTPQQLAGIDVLVFDVQDIGCRSYTYISTMVVAMEAAAEQGKFFVVLDRPNPMGGWRVEGPPVEPRWKSFVSQVPIPYVHGMTVGELAMMTAAHGWISRAPRMTVVKMQGWTRNMTWANTGLRWHATSPNIPHAMSPFYYVATGILGGAAAVDIGIGTDNPFGYAGGSGVNAQAMLAACQGFGTSGVSFSPYSRNGFGGVRLSIHPQAQTDLTALDVRMLEALNRLTSGRALARMSGDKLNLFHKVAGSDSLYQNLRRGVPASRIISGWGSYTQSFRSSRQRHLMYA
jgi:uncharacterized protein YbbC (DUF1343 family)